MKLTLTFRNTDDVDQNFKDMAEEKVEKLERYFDRIHSSELIFDHEGERVKIQLIVSAVRGQMFISEVEEVDAIAALDSVIEKMERQMKRFKDRIKRKDRRSSVRSGRLIQEMMEARTGSLPDEDEETYQEYMDHYDFDKNA